MLLQDLKVEVFSYFLSEIHREAIAALTVMNIAEPEAA